MASHVGPTIMEVEKMINNSTVDKLIEMRLTAMSDAFRQQMSDPRMNEISFEERFGMMVDIEYTRRKKQPS